MKFFIKYFTFFLTIIYLQNLTAQEEPIFSMGKFATGAKVKLFAHNVNVRTQPNTKTGNIISQLPIATELTILEEAEPFTINGYKAPWYKVSFFKDNNLIQGYLWGGFLSVFSFNLDNDNLLLYGFYGDDNIQKFMSQIKIVKNNEIITKLHFEPVSDVADMTWDYNYTVSAKLLPGTNFDGVKNIIQINYNYPACGAPFGDIIIFWTGEKLIYGTTVHGLSEAGIFESSYEIIYPNTKTKNKLIINKIVEEYDDNGNELPKKITRCTYKWENNKLTLIEEKEIK